MGTFWRSFVCVVAVVVAISVLGGGTAAAVGVSQGSIPATAPTTQTPQVLDHAVQDLARSGSRIIASGTFTQVRDAAVNGGTTFSQPFVFAFDDTTGAVDRGFRPTVNGVVNAVLPGPNDTVYIGGSFSRVNGTPITNLAQLSLATGQLTAFRPAALNGAVNDVLLAGTRLIVGGVFSTAGGAAHVGLASLNPTTGALDPYMTVGVLGHHNWDGTTDTAHGSTGVENVDLSPDGTRLVVIGNFTSADGLHRDQVMIVRLTATGTSVDPDWETHAFEAGCYTFAFDYYVRALQFAPDGSYFVIATTGGSNPGTHCDTITRWNVTDTGSDVQPRWTAYSGGDSSFAVAVTGAAVYAGGHSRWLNNENGSDSPGTGAVPRPSLSALDPRTGMPLAWNPGRHPRGVGVQAMLATAGGLYIGSDTEYIGNRQYVRPRMAYFPLAGGTVPAAENLRSLPANVFMAGRATATAGAAVDAVVSRYYDGSTPGPDATTPSGGVAWGRARGAFMINNTLFYGFPNPDANGDYYLYERTFDGTTFGPATVLNPYSDPVWNTTPTGSRWTTEYYRGVPADLYGQELSTLTGMVYAGGFLYYARAGSPALYYRAFSPDSGVVEAREHVASAGGFGDVAGMFLSGGSLYWASAATGELRTTTFADGVPGATSSLSAPGPAAGGRDWRSRTLFAGPGGPVTNAPPTAAFTSSCNGLTCSFDATSSSDDGSVAAYSWNWGDSTADGTGATPTHTYGAAGTYPVTLTVTDDGGLTDTETHPVAVGSQAATIAFRGSAGVSQRGVRTSTVTVPGAVAPGDALVLVWSGNSSTLVPTTPAGWTLESTQASGNIGTRVYSKVATASDANKPVSVSTGTSTAKVTLQVAAYSGTSTADPVTAITGGADTGGTSHTTPTTSAAAGSWVVSLWSDKQSAARTWTAPASGLTTRSNLPGVGSGDVATLLGDTGPVAAGAVGGLTATVPTPSAQATAFTVVLEPGAAGPPPNQPPTAAISSTCSAHVCSFDAGNSADADGTVQSYAWDFGDGSTGSATPVDHTYGGAGDYVVTLTVTDDDGATGTATSTVPVSDAPPAAGIGLRASAGSSARAVTSVAVDVPSSVQAGDGLLLVLTTNSTVSGTTPAGYTLAGARLSGTGPNTQVFSRVAAAADAGTTLSVSLTGQAKVTLQLLAHSGTAASGPVASLASAADGGGTSHTTPTATAAAGSWVVSIWADKGPDARQWTAPSTTSERSNLAGVGSGDIAGLVADSGAAVPAGQVGGLTATVPTGDTRATTFTVVLAAG